MSDVRQKKIALTPEVIIEPEESGAQEIIEKKRRGRPKIVVPVELYGEIEEMSGRGLNLDEIAHNIGIQPRVLDKRISENPEVKEVIHRGKSKAKRFVTNKLFELIESGDKASIFFYLKTQCGWRETNVTEISGKDGKPLEIETKYKDIDVLMKERFKQLLNKDDKDDGGGKSR